MLKSINSIVYDILLPVIIMVAGISLTSIDFFERSPSRILSPSRVSNDSQKIYFDAQALKPNKTDVSIKNLANLLNEGEEFDITYWNDMNYTESSP